MKNYFEYFPVPSGDEPWGVRCTAMGHWQILPHQLYPPRIPPHPADHDFTWQRGRILQDLQLLYISDGEGILEYKENAPHRIQAGTVFLVVPGVWHRYRPNSETGWTEYWLEISGDLPKKVLKEYPISLRKPFFSVKEAPEIFELFLKCQRLADTRQWGFEQQMGLNGLEILLLTLRAASLRKSQGEKESYTELEIRKFQQKLQDASSKPIKIDELLKDSTLSEVHFRRLFKKRTGMSPKQYVLEIRLRRTMDLLRQTRLSLSEIAERLGYDTPYHLSQDFKKRVGISPAFWRAAQWEKPT
ncbi:MAG: AraC family transcriptional regulator [Chthoniobacterales bacterium]